MSARLQTVTGLSCFAFVLALFGCGQKSPSGDDESKSLTVGLQFPPNNAVVQDMVSIMAGVSGGSGGTVVTFLIDQSVVSVDSSAPYRYDWNPNNLPNGSPHTLQVVGVDSEGKADTSGVKTVFAKWRLLGTGSGSSAPRNLRGIYARSSDLSIEFRVEFDNNWTDYKSSTAGIDCFVFLDIDRNGNTGGKSVSNGETLIPIGDIGAEYRIIIGAQGDSMWVYNSLWTGGRLPRLVKVTSPSNVFEFAVQHGDIGGPSSFNLVAVNRRVTSPSGVEFDWVPSSGHFTYTVDMLYFGPTLSMAGLDVSVEK